MAEVFIYSSAGEPQCLSSVAPVSDLTWSTRWGAGGGGCYEASWSMDMPATGGSQLLVQGRTILVMDGPIIAWRGRLSEPERGEPWRLHARGLASFGSDFLCLYDDPADSPDLGPQPTSVPSLAVDGAISRGLPWVNKATLSTSAFSASSTTADLNRVDTLLNAWTEGQGTRWGVFAEGDLIVAADPTSPTWHLLPSTPIGGVADDEFATHVVARYVASAAGTPPVATSWASVTVGNSNTESRWGRREYPLDLTPLGLMNATRATSLAQARLNQAGQRMGWTTALEVSADELTAVGGTPARLASIRAGQMLRIFGIADTDGALAFTKTQDVVLGEVRYRDGDSTIYLAPVGLLPRSLSDVLAAPVAPDKTFSA